MSKRGKSVSAVTERQGLTPVFRIYVEVKLKDTAAPLVVTVLLEVQVRNFAVGAEWWKNWWDLAVRLDGECLMRIVRLLAIMEEVGV